MEIVIDNIIFYLQKAGGISTVFAELDERLNDSAHEVCFIEREKPEANAMRRGLSLRNVIYKGRLPLSIGRYLSLKLNKRNPYIFCSSYYRYVRDKAAINCTVVHDFTYERYVGGLAAKVHHMQKKAAIKRSEGIICISEHTKRDLLHYFPFTAEKQIRVIYNGISNTFFPIDKTKFIIPETLKDIASKKYILFIGARQGYKNFDKVVDSLKLLPKEYDLVVIGGDFTEKEKTQIGSDMNRCILVKYPSQENINTLYNYAYCLVYPSLYEGFGIPVGEAMRCGCPVICVNASSIPEVAGDAVVMLDEVTPERISEAVQYMDDMAVRDVLIQKGFVQSAKFSWDKHYEEIEAFFHELMTKSK